MLAEYVGGAVHYTQQNLAAKITLVSQIIYESFSRFSPNLMACFIFCDFLVEKLVSKTLIAMILATKKYRAIIQLLCQYSISNINHKMCWLPG